MLTRSNDEYFKINIRVKRGFNMRYKALHIISVFLFTLLPTINVSASDQNSPSWLVSVQYISGEHVCNGSYVGNHLILVSDRCLETITLPPITLPPITLPINPQPIPIYPTNGDVDKSTINDTLTGKTATFYTKDGIAHTANIVATYNHPHTGSNILYRVDTVPENVEALTVASSKQIRNLPIDTNLTMTGWNLDILENEVSSRHYRLLDPSLCDVTANPFNDKLCLEPVETDCIMNNGSQGAPIVATLANGQHIQVGIKDLENCGLGTQIATGHLRRWINTIALQNKGLSIATAYEFPEQSTGKTSKLRLRIDNNSNENMSFSQIKFLSGQVMHLERHNCHHLRPGNTCYLSVKSQLNDPIPTQDELQITTNQTEFSVMLLASATARHYIRGDNNSKWLIKGWRPYNSGAGHSLYTDVGLAESRILQRENYIVGPNTLTLRYRTPEFNFGVLGIYITNKSINSSDINLSGFRIFNGTNGQWQELEIPIPDPGSYHVSFSPFVFPSGASESFIEIDSICFGSCDH